jgi:hypothetical protein
MIDWETDGIGFLLSIWGVYQSRGIYPGFQDAGNLSKLYAGGFLIYQATFLVTMQLFWGFGGSVDITSE